MTGELLGSAGHEVLLVSEALGAIINVSLLIGIGIKMHHRMSHFVEHVRLQNSFLQQEHEMLVQWYAKEHNIPLDELPTRLEKAPWWKNGV